MRRLAYFMLAVVSGVARGTINVTHYKTATPKPETCVLDVYKDESKIHRPYEALCLIGSKTGTTLFADKSVHGAIQQAALRRASAARTLC